MATRGKAEKVEIEERQLELAWAAGFVDGEGCVTLVKGHDKRRDYLPYSLYWPCIQVSQAATPQKFLAMRRLQRLFGGCIMGKEARGARPFAQYFWRITNLKAVNAAREMMPYLTVKKGHAELLIRYQSTCRYGHRKHVPPDAVSERELIVSSIRSLNLRGIDHPLFPGQPQRLSEVAPAEK